ncbi:MAG: response regulator [bacterium]|nr:response regulator [Gammaproteobacteria bacterium]HIL95830.1 response regulator [Pseudomonadales bacterium]
MINVLSLPLRYMRAHSTKAWVALGQAGMIVSLILTAAILGLLPDRDGMLRESYTAVGEAVAANSSVFLTRSDIRRMEANLAIIVERNSKIQSAGIRTEQGLLVVEIGNHESQWATSEDTDANSTQVYVPIWQGSAKWGQVELRFPPLRAAGWKGWFSHPLVNLIVFLTLSSFLLFFFYLGRILKQLDPSQAVPDRVRSAFDTLAEGLLVIDARQNIVLANAAFASIVDRTPQELMGHQAGNFPWANMNADPFDNDQAPWTLALKEGTQQTNTRLRLELVRGRSWTFIVNCSPVQSEAGKASGVLISFDDVTELEGIEIELQKSKEEADAANQSKSDFLANMSHEIRTPMNAILGFTDALRRGFDKNGAESRKYLNTIYSSGTHLLDLINDILDLSKVEAGRIEIETVPFGPHLLVHEIVKIMTVKAAEKDVFIQYEPDGPLPVQIESDPGKIRQILTNLIGNAIKFTQSGGVTVATKFETKESRSLISFEVKDTGIGMTKEQTGMVFESFVQADSSITRRFGGTGLGLAISKRYAEALGGDILVKSVPDEGSVFTCTIEVLTSPDVEILEPQQLLLDDEIVIEESGMSWVFPTARILAVDDGEENIALLGLVLRELNLEVDTAVNGKIAVEMTESHSYDLVLMDVSMPMMDGYEAVGRMRKQGLKIPIIALTAHAMKGAEEKCLAAGYSGYMTKPIDIEKLTADLAKNLNAESVVDSENTWKNSHKQPRGHNKEVIRSSLLTANPKISELVARFIIRLDEQLGLVEQAFDQGDFEEVARISHWLKGSAGSIRFHEFTEPAKKLEDAAQREDFTVVSELLHVLQDMAGRLQPMKTKPGRERRNRPIENMSSSESAGQAGVDRKNDRLVELHARSPIYSSLHLKNEKLRELVGQFVTKLEKQLVVMEQAREDRNYDQMTLLSHWLKGSAGSVGFQEFTVPAAELEIASGESDDERIDSLVVEINNLFNRIELLPALQTVSGYPGKKSGSGFEFGSEERNRQLTTN